MILRFNTRETNRNKRAQRALGRSPEEKVQVTVEPFIENPRGII